MTEEIRRSSYGGVPRERNLTGDCEDIDGTLSPTTGMHEDGFREVEFASDCLLLALGQSIGIFVGEEDDCEGIAGVWLGREDVQSDKSSLSHGAGFSSMELS